MRLGDQHDQLLIPSDRRSLGGSGNDQPQLMAAPDFRDGELQDKGAARRRMLSHWAQQRRETGRIDREVDMILVEGDPRSEEHTSELQSLMRRSYAVFCLKKNKQSHTQ